MNNHFKLEVFDSSSIFKNQYMYDSTIIETRLSAVYEVIDINTHYRYALKVIPIDFYNQISDKLSLSFGISHSNIITTFKIIIDSDESPKFAACLMELGYGDVITLQDEIKGSEQEVKKIIYDSLRGLKYLHEYHICHHNIKPENIVAKSYREPRTYALCDFSCAIKNENDIFDGPFRGTPIYSAPELLENRQYTNKVDIWSLGVVMYTLLTGYFPFGFNDANVSFLELLEMIRRNPINSENLDSFSVEAKDLIYLMLCIDPDHRISADDALQHPWFKDDLDYLSITDRPQTNTNIFYDTLMT